MLVLRTFYVLFLKKFYASNITQSRLLINLKFCIYADQNLLVQILWWLSIQTMRDVRAENPKIWLKEKSACFLLGTLRVCSINNERPVYTGTY